MGEDPALAPTKKTTSAPIALVSLTDDSALLHQVKKLNLGVLPVPCPDFCYHRALRDANHLSWAAVVHDGTAPKVVGALLAEAEKDVLCVRTLAVSCSHRRRGVATRLLRQVMLQAQQLDAEVSQLEVNVQVNNDEAIGFYEKCGFQRVDTIEDYYRAHVQPRACFVYRLGLAN